MSTDNRSEKKSSIQLNVSEWVKLYGDYLYNYCIYRVNHAEEAEDLVQDTFLSAIKAKDSFRGDCSEKTWLLTILKRKIIDFYRKKSIQSIQQSINSEQIATGYEEYFIRDGKHEGHWSSLGKPNNWSVSSSTLLETKEFYKVLQHCFSLMPEKWSSVFKMKIIEEMETELICKELNLNASNYWVIMHRAKLQLRKCMALNWYEAK